MELEGKMRWESCEEDCRLIFLVGFILLEEFLLGAASDQAHEIVVELVLLEAHLE